MKFFIALFFVVLYNNACSANFCKSSYKLWLCTNGTATFNEVNYEEVRYVHCKCLHSIRGDTYVHYRPLMMSQKQHLWVFPKKEGKMV